MVVTLTEADLRENNQLAVICLSERDLASQHRIVIELSPNFFVDNDIQQNIHGVILLKSSDLAHPEAIEVAKAPRKEMGARIRKPKAEGKSTAISYIFAIMSSTKANLLAWPFLIMGIAIGFHFKYSWTTISEERYQYIRTESSTLDWIYPKMFKYRTQDSSWRWYGQQLLNTSDYKKMAEQSSLAWLFYDDSQEENVGDSLEN